MSKRAPATLHDLVELYGGGHMLLTCLRCGRKRLFDVHELYRHWKAKRWDDRWRAVGRRFICANCRGRADLPYWIEPGKNILPEWPHACLAPYGINPWAWARAEPHEREKLIKARR